MLVMVIIYLVGTDNGKSIDESLMIFVFSLCHSTIRILMVKVIMEKSWNHLQMLSNHSSMKVH